MDWIWIGVDWDWTGQIGLDWIGSRRGLRWVRFNVREDFWAPPFRLAQQWPKIDGCDVMGRNGTTICGSVHAWHRSVRTIIDSDVG